MDCDAVGLLALVLSPPHAFGLLMQEKLRSPLFFVSPTRLVVTNLSRTIKSAKLGGLFHKVSPHARQNRARCVYAVVRICACVCVRLLWTA